MSSKRHLNKLEGQHNEQFSCSTCQKSFVFQSGLLKHKTKCGANVTPEPVTPMDMQTPLKEFLLEMKNEIVQGVQQQIENLKVHLNPVINVDVGQITNTTNYNIEKAIMYLNTERQDVTPMRDVIENMEITNEDLHVFETEPYAKMATEMFLRAYLALPKIERPFFSFIKDDGTHGSEVTIKGEEKWHYETNTDMTLYRGITRAADINMYLLFRCIDELCIKINVEISERCGTSSSLTKKITEMRNNPKVYTKIKALICHDICSHNDAVFDE